MKNNVINKTIMPINFKIDGRTLLSPFHIKIEYQNGNLSLTGVIGAFTNGNCAGSSGQCHDYLESLIDGEYELTDGFTLEDVKKLHEIWTTYHLNDMQPYCQHQKELGWRDLASKKAIVYNYRLNNEATTALDNTKKAIIKAVEQGESFTPTPEQTYVFNLKYFITSHKSYDKLDENLKNYYEPEKQTSYSRPSEQVILGHTYQKNHPDGILCKPCPVCGYEYGSKWLKEEVPTEVIEWLTKLSNASVECNWNTYQ